MSTVLAVCASLSQVTLVKNLEVYGIDPAEFAHKLQVKVAGSTSGNKRSSLKLPGH